jgi:hypothetical protein
MMLVWMLSVGGSGIWRSPGDNEEVAAALCEALRNRIERLSHKMHKETLLRFLQTVFSKLLPTYMLRVGIRFSLAVGLEANSQVRFLA